VSLTVSTARPFCDFQLHVHLTAIAVVLNRVGQKMVMTCARRSASPVISTGGVRKRSSPALVGERFHRFGAIGNGFGKIKGQAFQNFLAGVEAREFKQRFNEPSHSLRSSLAGFHDSRYSDGLRSRLNAVCACVSMTETGVRSSCAASAAIASAARTRRRAGRRWNSRRRQLAEFAFGSGNGDALDKSPAEIFVALR